MMSIIIFEDISTGIKYNSWYDFCLILNSKEMSSPLPKVDKVSVPGRDGELDFTEFFGEVKYQNRKLTFNFSYTGEDIPYLEYYRNDAEFFKFYYESARKYTEIQNIIHGKKLKIFIVPEDPDHYYIGRCTVDGWRTDRNIGIIRVECDCDPYKYNETLTTITRNIEGSKSIVLYNGRKTVIPKVSTDAPITISWAGGSAALTAGSDQIVPDLVLRSRSTEITVTGNATVSFVYRKGNL